MEIQQKPSPNFSDTHLEMDGIVLHATLSSFDRAVNHLRNSKGENPVSSHFVFGRNGEVAQLVDLDKMAWHSGNVYKPTNRGKKILKRNIFRKGGYANPNKHLIGFEFACGWDIDKDGIIESWERLFSPQQIKNAVRVAIELVEPITGELNGANTPTHKDIASYKPNLEIPRLMFLSELSKQRSDLPKGSKEVMSPEEKKIEIVGNKYEKPTPPPVLVATELELNDGEILKFEIRNGKIIVRKR